MTSTLTSPTTGPNPAPKPPVRSRPGRRRRRRHSAYEVILIGIVAYAVAGLLNARSLHERAESQEYGARRDVLVGLTGVLVRAAEMTGLDTPGEVVDAARGRERSVGAPAVVTLPPLPPVPTTAPPARRATTSVPAHATTGPVTTAATPVPAPPPTPTPVAPATTAVPDTTTTLPAPTTTVSPYVTVRTPTGEDPLRVWVGGDSLAVGLGWSFARLGAATGLIAPTEAAEISSGLSRPDYFDWPSEIQRVVAEEGPEVLVVMFGANDAQAMQTEAGRLPFGSPEWEAEYRARVQAVMALGSQDRRLVWVGEPIVRDGALDAKMQVIDRIQREEATAFPNVTFVDGRTLFSSPEGGYTDRLPSGDGGEVFVRGGDGVHPNATGYDRLAAAAAWEIIRLTDPTQAELPAPAVEPGAPVPSA